MFPGQDVSILIKLSERLYSDLTLASNVYHGVFVKILNLDYHSYVYHVIASNMARDTGEAMVRVNKALAANESKQ